ncbi:MAG: fasciclin domain-containing protein [Polaribacter sp.]
MKYTFILFLVAITIFSCSNKDYLVDGGLSQQNTGTTTLDFLKGNNQLDTLAILIERAGYADIVNGSTTLFAPNNLSIKKYVEAILTKKRNINPLAQYTINDIPLDTLHKYLGGYIFTQKIKREDMTKEGKIYTAYNNTERRISLEPVDDPKYRNQLSGIPEFVFYTYKKGLEWDKWDQTKGDDDSYIIRTSNLISTNGVIHVIQGNHILFNYK